MKICEATLCDIPFKVYTCNNGGAFDCGTRRIEIGLNGSWSYTVSILLHEALECTLALHHSRFCDPGFAPASDSYVFQFNHNTFSNVCADSAFFVANVLPSLQKAWKAYQKGRRS